MEIEQAIGEELKACRRKKLISQEQLGFDVASTWNRRWRIESLRAWDRMRAKADWRKGLPHEWRLCESDGRASGKDDPRALLNPYAERIQDGDNLMAAKDSQEKYGALWTRQELILAFDLYCRIPFRKTKANNPEVIELSRLLGRSPASVARKLGNFGSFDPELQKRNISGLAHAGKLDAEIWDEFNSDWNRLVLEANRLRVDLGGTAEVQDDTDTAVRIPHGASEREVVRKTRIHQAFFRDVVLSSYDGTCCITGLRVPECLVASHIVPWSISEQHRTDPRNGLCLSATFDRLFDRGLITVGEHLDVIVSTRLRKARDEKILDMICKHHGSPIVRPRRFLPSPAHLEWHRTNVFRP